MKGAFDHMAFSVRANLLGSKLTVLGPEDGILFTTVIMDLGHHSELTLFTGKKASRAALQIQPVVPEPKKGLLSRFFHFLHAPSHYDVIDDPTGEKIGSIALQEGGRNPVAQVWTASDSADQQIARLEPCTSGFLGAKFKHACYVEHDRICWFTSRNAIAGREVKIELSQDADHTVDARLLLAVAAKMLVDIVNVGGGD